MLEGSTVVTGLSYQRLIAAFPDIAKKAVITREYPEDWRPGKEPYYPVGDERNRELYQKYLELAEEYPDIIFGGRLGEYRCCGMDEVIAAARERARESLAE